ncbi:TonB-dependent receptor [Roseivirga sp.]|uniref:TonB-dependent receptor n=1 Tax=Roseivirga sp. TaxID=1964215 RepID=UPI003B523780
MIRFITSCTFFLLILNIQGQTLTVRNQLTGKPIALVTIQEKGTDRGAVTDENGMAVLKGFSAKGTLIFRHPSYRSLMISYKEIQKSGFQVTLMEDISQMDDVVVSANRWEQYPEEVPQQIAEMNKKEIARAEPATAADLLSINSEVFVQKSQLGGGSPMIRGFAANGVLLVIDGVRMNNAIYRSGNLQNIITLDPASIEKAEVVFGPSSVVYGSDALGGVMDFHTRVSSFSESGQMGLASGGFMRVASANTGLTGNYHLEFTMPKFTSFTSLTYSKFGDLRTGSKRTDDFPDFGKRPDYVERVNGIDVIVANDNENLQRPSGYDQYNALQKFRWKLGSFADFSYSFHYSSSSDIHRYDRLIERDDSDLLRYAEWYYGPQNWQMHSFQSNYTYPHTFFDRLKLTTALQKVEESRHSRRFQSDQLANRKEKVNIISVNADAYKSLGFGDELYYGLELVTNQVESSAYTENIVTGETGALSTRYPDGGSDYNSAAIYLSIKKKISQRLIWNSGIRYTFTKLNSQFDDKTFYDFPFDEIKLNQGALTGNFGLVMQAGKGWKLSTLFSSGFRAPNVDDVGKVFDSEPGTVIVPNANAKPEYSYNLEYSIGRNIQDKFSFNFVNYFSFLRDALVRRPFTFNGQSEIDYDGTLSAVFAEQNVGEAFIWGLSLSTRWSMANGIQVTGNINYTQGEDTIEHLPLRHVTPLFGELGMSMTQSKLTSTFKVKFSGGIAFEDLAPSEQAKTHLYTTDGALPWYTINIYNSYQLDDYYSIHLNLENLLDTHYRPYSSGISAPGFNAVISFRADF